MKLRLTGYISTICYGLQEKNFEIYYQQRVNDEILQLAGRQRVNRYPDQKFNLFKITSPDADLKWLEQYGATINEINQVSLGNLSLSFPKPL